MRRRVKRRRQGDLGNTSTVAKWRSESEKEEEIEKQEKEKNILFVASERMKREQEREIRK